MSEGSEYARQFDYGARALQVNPGRHRLFEHLAPYGKSFIVRVFACLIKQRSRLLNLGESMTFKEFFKFEFLY